MSSSSIAGFGAACAVLLLSACASSPPATPPAELPDDLGVVALEIQNLVVVEPHHLASGQPTAEQFEALRALGFTTVVGLRPADEEGTGWEEEAASEQGMTYVRLPVAGPEDLTFDLARDLDDALRQAATTGSGTLVTCSSGNRVGGLFALRASLAGVPPEEAFELGQRAGMTRMAPRVRQLLGLPPE